MRKTQKTCDTKKCFSLRMSPSFRRNAHYRPTVYLKGVTSYLAVRMQKDREREILCPFAVGANYVRPWAFTERPYEDDFLSVGKSALWKAPLVGAFLT